jgi:hypothetical protein
MSHLALIVTSPVQCVRSNGECMVQACTVSVVFYSRAQNPDVFMGSKLLRSMCMQEP